MRATHMAKTPFDEGKQAVKLGPDIENPHSIGSVEHRNYELGRQFGLRQHATGDRFRANKSIIQGA